MSLIKIFSGNESLALMLQTEIEMSGIKTILKNNNQVHSGKPSVVELFIKKIELEKVSSIIETFRLRL